MALRSKQRDKACILILMSISLCIGLWLLVFEYLSGGEFIALTALGCVFSFGFVFSRNVIEISFAGNAVKLSRENEEAKKNIFQLKRLTKAAILAHINQFDSMHHDHADAAIFKINQFLRSYRVVQDLALDNTQVKVDVIPNPVIERVTREFLSNTTLYVEAEALYGDNTCPLPTPERILKKYKGRQKDGVANSTAFNVYKVDLLPILKERGFSLGD